jgi:hypothetical protein
VKKQSEIPVLEIGVCAWQSGRLKERRKSLNREIKLESRGQNGLS